MSEATYIHPVGWEKFQHGLKRDYPWIKNYTRLLAKNEYLSLTPRDRAILHGLWLLYHESGGELANKPRQIGGQLAINSLQSRDLERLNHAGFIRFSDSTEVEVDREREKKDQRLAPTASVPAPPPPRRKSSKSASPPAPPAMTATSSTEQSASRQAGVLATSLAIRERNPGWEYAVELDGEPLEQERNAYGRIAADLNKRARTELNGATPDEYLDLFRSRRQALVDEWGEGKASLRSLVKNWGPAKRFSEARRAPASGSGAIGQKALEVASQLRREAR